MENSVVKTYMNFTKEIDPANIVTMADLELSVALASPLVTFNKERQIVAALAEKWINIEDNKIKFVLRKDLKWSDGSVVTALQFKDALERARKLYSNDLKALFDSIQKIETLDGNSLIITTKNSILKSGLLLKLTEPMYGLMAITNGKLDLSKTAGPFYVEKSDANNIRLRANKNWYEYSSEMPQVVEIKRLPKDIDVVANFKNDEWANLISGTSLMKIDIKKKMDDGGFKTWQRTLDKVFSFFPSKRFLDRGGSNFVKALASKLNREDVLEGFSGYTIANQFFPRGYELWSPEDPKTKTTEKFDGHSNIHVIIPDNSYAAALKDNLQKTLSSVMGVKIECTLIPVTEISNYLKKGNFDLLAGGLAVADPNFEGAMSFFIERDPPFISSTLTPNDFSVQMTKARSLPTSKERAAKMREIIIAAQEAGHVLPLFHFSSLAIAKPGIDLSEVPNSDETVLFSKVRMR